MFGLDLWFADEPDDQMVPNGMAQALLNGMGFPVPRCADGRVFLGPAVIACCDQEGNTIGLTSLLWACVREILVGFMVEKLPA